jgi:hypothetical protein
VQDTDLTDVLLAVLRDSVHPLTVSELVDAAARRLVTAEQVWSRA